MGLILLIVLIVLLIGTLPSWPYSRGWGYSPISFLAVILIVILLLLYFNVIGFWNISVDNEDNGTTIRIERQD